MILAGGLSTRLYPLTKQVPKPLVPVGLEPNAVHVMRYLASFGYDEIALNVYYHAKAIVDRLGDGSAYGVKLQYLHEGELLGSAGAVKQMENFLSGDDFVVIGCDDLTDLPLNVLADFHRKKKALATIGLVPRERVEQYGVVLTADDGRITGFQEKPKPGTERSKAVNTGVYAFSPNIFEHIPPATFIDFGKDIFPALQQSNAAFYGYDAGEAYWCDIGTIEEYWRASIDVLCGRFHIPNAPASGIDESAVIAPSAIVQGEVLIGERAVIEENARIIGPAVISQNVHIGAGARVEESILWEGTRVGEGARVARTIVGVDYRIAARDVLESTVVANEEPVEPLIRTPLSS